MASSSKLKNRRFYVRNTVVPFEEDMTHEFKGHRNIAKEELPPWTQGSKDEKASRRAVSRTLNAFLNTGKGGTCYLGIVDNGTVLGIQLTRYQKDHVLGSLDDVMARYVPPVKQHRYKVRFVPVLDSDQDCSEDKVFESDQLELDERRRQPHRFRTCNDCWCVNDQRAQFQCGVFTQGYIIEIVIKPWDPNDLRNADDAHGSIVKLQPYHENEEGKVYFRRQASLVQYTLAELALLTRQEVRASCESEIERLKEQILQIKMQKSSKT